VVDRIHEVQARLDRVQVAEDLIRAEVRPEVRLEPIRVGQRVVAPVVDENAVRRRLLDRLNVQPALRRRYSPEGTTCPPDRISAGS
jgi:hypothetical protein